MASANRGERSLGWRAEWLSSEVDPIRADDVMSGKAWESFCDRLKRVGSELMRDDVPGDPQNRSEGVRHLTRLLSYALDVALEFSDADRPVFHPHTGLSYKWGGDNPENLYQHAAIDGSHSYRICGRRNSECDFILQASACGPMEAPGTGDRREKDVLVFSELDSRELEIAVDGSFEILVGPKKPEGQDTNWLPTHPDVGWILIRQYFADWDRERPAEFLIERVGHEGTSPPPLSPARLADQLDSVVSWVEHEMPYWTKWVHEEHLRFPPNTCEPLGEIADGVARICYGCGRFDMAEDEVVIFECEVPQARFWQVGLLNFWFETLDYVNHQSCLNGHSIRPDADGRFRLVIAPRDPGVPNWLDSDGHRTGLIQYRWIWHDSQPTPTCRVVPLEKLRQELPTDTPVVTSEDRRRAIRRRREAVLRRFHLY